MWKGILYSVMGKGWLGTRRTANSLWTLTQVKKVNGQKVYYQHCYADAVQNRYRYAREASYYLKLDRVSDDFLIEFTEAMKEKPRIYSVDTFVHTYKLKHVDVVVPSTKTLYIYI